MILEGAAVVIRQDNIDTDVLYPGSYLNIADPEQMKPYLFEGLDPSLRDQLGRPTILVVGENFGTGSSREHVPHAMLAWGIRCVLGKSFARIFYRNCINLGLPAIVCPEAVDAAEPGVTVRIDTDTGTVHVGDATFQAVPLPSFMRDMLASGGLVDWARRRLAEAG
ncbi:3-isopropylmalate dehydratase small subunit [Sphaerobacter sp.]|uniref:LeuD/DmdB family oxidoreductase small subunit n=1 Tax=Sphaerobacter sp. TaxID=2099654 RepID=UPI001D9C409A|nr:3-isopropylmalate dehydratase small subunit [Sphaerobacter sp.]MBX5445704.1 3-isopropylmalate dehydratase small subunit [Sphaerobacter sp.]